MTEKSIIQICREGAQYSNSICPKIELVIATDLHSKVYIYAVIVQRYKRSVTKFKCQST